MAKDWYLIGGSPIYNSGFENDEFQQHKNDGLDEVLNSPISSAVQIVDNNLNAVSNIRAVVQNNLANISSSALQRHIMTKIGTLNSGDYIKYDNETYLINSAVGNNQWYEKAIMQYCNYTLKFQSPTGAILSYPCYTSGNKFSQDENKVITLNSNQKSILLPKDENTLTLKSDRRLFVDTRNQSPYKIIGDIDTTTYNYGDKGLIEVLVEQDELLTGDRQDLGICNYFEPSTEPTPPVDGYSYATITCSNPNNEIKLGSSIYRTLTPTFFNADDSMADDIVAVWSWELPIGYESYFDIKYEGNSVKVKVKADSSYELLGMTFKCSVMGSNGGYGGIIELIISI